MDGSAGIVSVRRVLKRLLLLMVSIVISLGLLVPSSSATADSGRRVIRALSSSVRTGTTTSSCRATKDTRSTSQKKHPFIVCGVAFISRHHRVSAAYHPKLVTVAVRSSGISRVRLQQVAGTVLKKMFAAAKKAGYTLTVRSAYRSYATQKSWYVAGSTLVAPPGASEHQSGLAVDLAAIRNGHLVRGTAFGASATGRWVHKHAAAYGFIQRYPSGTAKITTIRYEPWHYRYVGTEVAAAVIATKTKTLERYLHVSA